MLFERLLVFTDFHAGREADGERAFQRMLEFVDSQGRRPFAEYYDTLDAKRMSNFPISGLPAVTWPDPSDHLPSGVSDALIVSYDSIASEAAAVHDRGKITGDAYPGISPKKQWSKLVLFTAGSGWDEKMCEILPTVCDIVRGKLRTEQKPMTEWYKGNRYPMNDEAVILFKVKAGGLAYLHTGQASDSTKF